ncbi:CoA transferase [Nocardioides sp.]|uniref:CoA transferase n=1 Tax=Nocardioides sp. TaxID=35761 RepID=UPI0039E35FD7
MRSADPAALRDWAASGAMALTGRRDGPPLAAPGDPAGQVRRQLDEFADLTRQRTGERPALPGVALLGERAAIARLARNAPYSCGGAFRAIGTMDGWLGLSLPRDSDRQLVPALIETEPAAGSWEAVAAWAARRTSAVAAARARLLGLACAPIPDGSPVSTRAPVLVTPGGPRRRRPDRPRVVDLTSLWAGPLCAHLLGLTGAEVVKVESAQRPDGARFGPPAFFDLLHAGHRAVALDLTSAADLAALRRLIDSADLVLESSRTRALRQAGIEAEEVIEHGTSWLSITGYGRASDWIGFGDDVAAGAGLVVPEDDGPLPCGDALADPLTGVAAAAAAAAALLDRRARLIDVSMHDVALAAAGGRPPPHRVVRSGTTWWVETEDGEFPVAEPVGRPVTDRAPAVGADTAELLR